MSSNWQQAIAKILCYYTNSTDKIQVIRATNSDYFNFQKIVFPRQRILFETTSEGQLEIYTEELKKEKIARIIPCQNLQVELKTMSLV
jgi:hypothetical protein